MKKVVLLLAFFTLTACSTKQEEESTKSETNVSLTSETKIIENHQLEDVGMTYKESLEFDKFIEATNRIISSLDNKDLELTKKETVLLEETYLNNGGNNLDKFTKFINDDNFGFNKIAANSLENNREVTYQEAYGSLNYLLSFIEEIGENNGFNQEEINVIKTYFLINIDPSKPFSEASTDLLVNFK